VHAGWRDSRDFVEEIDWRRQLEHLSEAQRGKGNNSEADEN
jgi:hypothetical protein